MNGEGTLIGDISDNTKEYIKLQIDDSKLAVAEKLSILSSKIIATIVIWTLLSIAATIFVVALIVVLSYFVEVLYSLLIVGGAVTLLALITWRFRGRFMVNAMVRMYCKLIFESNEKKQLF